MKKKLLILLVSLAMLNTIQGQQYYYYGPNSKPVQIADDALVVKELRHKSDTKYTIKTRLRVEGDKSKDEWQIFEQEKITIENDRTHSIRRKGDGFFSKKIYRKMTERKPGYYEFSETDLSGGILRTGFSSSFLPLHLEGVITEYHSNRELKSISEFEDNQLVSNQNWLRTGEPYIDSVFYSTDREPEYKMGPEFFHSYILQSLANSKLDLSEVNDVVEVGWVVMENGEMEGVITLSGKSMQLNQLLVNTIAGMPGDWQPAMLDGKAVRYFISVPLNFSHLSASFQELELSSGTLHYNKY
ncbi:MAG: hypothetical protein QNK35_08980 [Bacteroides sp.]|nr:hypothetical protein [Bacteroides sp.]